MIGISISVKLDLTILTSHLSLFLSYANRGPFDSHVKASGLRFSSKGPPLATVSSHTAKSHSEVTQILPPQEVGTQVGRGPAMILP